MSLKFIFSIFLCLSVWDCLTWAKDIVRVTADPWCPFSCTADSKAPGIFVEVLKEALGDDYTIQYEMMSWSRAVADTRAGKFDAIIGAIHADAPDFIFPGVSFVNQQSCFYTNADSKWNFNGTESLKGLSFGAVKDYSYGEPIDSYLKSPAQKKHVDLINGVDVTERLVKKLKAHRNDVIVEDQSVMTYVIAKMQTKFPREAGCLKEEPLYVAFSPADKTRASKLVKAYEAGLKKIQKANSLSNIFNSYNLSR